MRPSVVKVAAWGDHFIDMMERNILPCLLAPDNLAAIASQSPTFLLLYVDRIPNKALLAEFNDIAGLNVIIRQMASDVSQLDYGRSILAWTEYDSLIAAQENDADWFNFQADTLISDHFLPHVKLQLIDCDAVFGSPIRTSIEQFESLVDDQREFSASELLSLSMQAMHPVVMNYFVCDPHLVVAADPHQLLFTAPDKKSFSCRTWQPCPYGVRANATGKLANDGWTIDCRALSSINRKAVRFQVFPDEGDFYLTTLDPLAGITPFGSFPVTIQEAFNSMNKFARDVNDLEYYNWSLSKTCLYQADGIALPDNCLDEKMAIKRLRTELLPFCQ